MGGLPRSGGVPKDVLAVSVAVGRPRSWKADWKPQLGSRCGAGCWAVVLCCTGDGGGGGNANMCLVRSRSFCVHVCVSVCAHWRVHVRACV